MRKLLLLLIPLLVAFTPTNTTLYPYWTTVCELDARQTRTQAAYTNVGFTVKNTGSAAFSACRVQAYSGPRASDVDASGTLTFTANAGDTKIVTIDTKVYTFQASLTDVDGNVKIGADEEESLDNLVAAITLGSGAGTAYAASTTLHPTVTAVDGAGFTMDATAKGDAGTDGNSIVSTTDVVGATWTGSTLEDGEDVWVDITGTWTSCQTLAAGALDSWSLPNNPWGELRLQVKTATSTTAWCRPEGTR